MAEVCTDGVMTWSELRFSCAVKMCLKSSQWETRTITFYDIKAPGCEANAVNLTPGALCLLAPREGGKQPVAPAQRRGIALKVGANCKVKFQDVLRSSESNVWRTEVLYQSYFLFS